MRWYEPLLALAWVFVVVCMGNIIAGTKAFSRYDIGVLVGCIGGGYFLYFLVNTFNKLRIPHVPKDE